MFEEIDKHRKIWAFVSVLALASAVVGVLEPSIYDEVVTSDIMPGVLSQDLVTIAVSVILLGLVYRMGNEDYVKQIVALGIVGYFFYAYGIYVIEQIYTPLYYFYLIVFALSSYSIVYGLVTMRTGRVERVDLPRSIRLSSVFYSLLIAAIFTLLWSVSIYSQIQAGERLDYFYSIYILELCFISPAFAIAAIETLRV